MLAAKKVRRATKTEFLISFTAGDFSRANDNYIGKLRLGMKLFLPPSLYMYIMYITRFLWFRSNFLGTKFVIYDSQPLCNHTVHSSGQSHKKFSSKKVLPSLPVGKYNVASIAYELNVLRTRGPRRMQCTMHNIPISAIEEGGTAPTPETFAYWHAEKFSSSSGLEVNSQEQISYNLPEPPVSIEDGKNPLVLRNKAPRWHEQLQCWCLNFKGRVTVASVKNFQLVAAVDPSQNIPVEEQEKVILQFGKIGKDIFTMDYRYPLSAFQAFAICLSSFDTKPACE